MLNIQLDINQEYFNNFQPLDVVDHVSDTQLKMGENSN